MTWNARLLSGGALILAALGVVLAGRGVEQNEHRALRVLDSSGSGADEAVDAVIRPLRVAMAFVPRNRQGQISRALTSQERDQVRAALVEASKALTVYKSTDQLSEESSRQNWAHAVEGWILDFSIAALDENPSWVKAESLSRDFSLTAWLSKDQGQEAGDEVIYISQLLPDSAYGSSASLTWSSVAPALDFELCQKGELEAGAVHSSPGSVLEEAVREVNQAYRENSEILETLAEAWSALQMEDAPWQPRPERGGDQSARFKLDDDARRLLERLSSAGNESSTLPADCLLSGPGAPLTVLSELDKGADLDLLRWARRHLQDVGEYDIHNEDVRDRVRCLLERVGRIADSGHKEGSLGSVILDAERRFIESMIACIVTRGDKGSVLLMSELEEMKEQLDNPNPDDKQAQRGSMPAEGDGR